MHRHLKNRLAVALLIGLAFSTRASAQAIEPIVYTVRVPKPETHAAKIEAVFPTGGRPDLAIMMAVWSPGFYRVEDYAKRVEDLAAAAPDGTPLKVEHPEKNRWKVETGGRPKVVVSYKLICQQASVTTNYVGEALGVFNGAASFITLVEQTRRPHEVYFELPPVWKQTMTALEAAPDQKPNHYRADDYETLVDSPIVAGNPSVHEFLVDGSKHMLVDVGTLGQWDGKLAAQEIEKLVQENRRLWGFLPFKRYLFLNVFRQGGAGSSTRIRRC